MVLSSTISRPTISEQSVIETVRRQIHTDQELGLVAHCDETVIEQVVSESVHALWTDSRIKTYLPVLALRRVRDQIRSTAPLH